MVSYIVLGAFFGDEGKGQWVNNLCRNSVKDDTIVIRFSGANQVGHNVLNDGIHHCFSNYGSGTLCGITTYWSEFCVCDPYTAVREGLDLIAKGVKPKIIYSPLCQLVLPCDVWHQWNNKDNREHGTVGTGYKAVLDRVKAGYSVTMVDALNPLILREKLRGVMKYYYKVEESNLPCFNYDDWVNNVHKYVCNIKLCGIDEILHEYPNRIYEGSQGILLDQRFGIMPYCTPSNTTSENAWKLIDTSDDITTYYVCRPYITRHGNGPFCTNAKVLDVVDPNNSFNEYQRTFRSCEFDINLLKHSLEIDNIFNKSNQISVVVSHCNELKEDVLNQIKQLTDSVIGFEYTDWHCIS